MTSEQVLTLAKMVEVHRMKKSILNAAKEKREFDMVKMTNQGGN